MKFEFAVRQTAGGRPGVAIQLLRLHEDILKPAQPVQCPKVRRDSSRVTLISGVKRELQFCGFRRNALKTYEPDFVDGRSAGHAVRRAVLLGTRGTPLSGRVGGYDSD